MLDLMYTEVKGERAVKTKFREWNALLAKVYGSALGNVNLFLTHTYLTVLSRVLVALILYPKVRRTPALYRGLMTGNFFKNRNIRNLAEPDFFSWALNTPAESSFFGFVENVFRRIDCFDWTSLDEDLLKMLYQELVDPEDRHELGEYYTPDWLAELALKEIDYRGGRLLDPACGSGTFLFCAIRKLRQSGFSGDRLVEYALESIIGLDVHPLAVLMSKANILLALAHELPDYNLKGHPKTGQRRSPQNRPMKAARDQVVLPRLAVIGQACFGTPTPWATLENVAMMEEAVEHGSHGGTIP